MPLQMFVDGRDIPIGDLQVSFECRVEKGKQLALLHVISPSGDDRLGGVALNCLYLGQVNSPEELFNKPLVFGKEDEQFTELRESCFWLPGKENLELISLYILIEPCTPKTVQLTLRSECFDQHGNSGKDRRKGQPSDVMDGCLGTGLVAACFL